MRIPGVGPTKAARIRVALELGVRYARETRPPVLRVRAPEDVVRLLAPRLRDLDVEQFHVLALDSQNQVIRDVLVTRGLLNSSNHPSGDPTPSIEDQSVTRQLVAAGRLLDLPVYDHIIIAGDRYVSLATLGLL
jgi:DNA repair protein RadC